MMNGINLIDKDIIFDSKPEAVPYNYRISYKVSLICLGMDLCCGRSGCSLIKLHILSNAVSNKDTKSQLIDYIKFNYIRQLLVRFDPVVNRSLDFCLAEKLIYQQANGLYRLTQKGKKFTAAIKSDNDLLKSEREIFTKISINLSEDKIRELTDYWRYINAKN
jgi:hypothetical protein